MIRIDNGQKVIDYLTDERRLAEDNPAVAASLRAIAEARNLSEELLYQGSIKSLHKDAYKLGRAVASIPMEAFLAISNLHPEWFMTTDKREFFKWLAKHPAYALERKIKR